MSAISWYGQWRSTVSVGEDDSSELDVNHDDDQKIKDDSEMEFEDDVCTLRNYSLIRTRDAARELFEMHHQLVQLWTRR